MGFEFGQLHDLPIAEKLRIVEQLWDDIGESDEPFPWMAWQRDEARRRVAELDADPGIALTREELWKVNLGATTEKRAPHSFAERKATYRGLRKSPIPRPRSPTAQ